MKNFCYILLLIAFLGACKTQNMLELDSIALDESYTENLEYFLSDTIYEYRIKSGDMLSLSIWGEDNLSVGSLFGIYNSNKVYGKWVMVDAEGFIEFPKIGSTYILGFTTRELKDTLKQVYAQWINKPVIDVKVLNKEVVVHGEVRTPGVVAIEKDQISLLKVGAKVGGYTDYADLTQVKIYRETEDDVKVVAVDLTKLGNYKEQNLVLYPGDVVVVPTKSYKTFDKRITLLIPFTTAVTAVSIILGFFN